MRNKISAWRKGGVVFTILLVTLTTLSEYVSILEMDIAERYRLLQAIRTEFGSIQSENVALRQEFAALKKKALLEGRIGTLKYIQVLNLPSPAPLPPISAAAATASAPALATLSSSSLVTPNTRKDIPNSPRLGGDAFCDGLSGFGGLGSVAIHQSRPFSFQNFPRWFGTLTGLRTALSKRTSIRFSTTRLTRSYPTSIHHLRLVLWDSDWVNPAQEAGLRDSQIRTISQSNLSMRIECNCGARSLLIILLPHHPLHCSSNLSSPPSSAGTRTPPLISSPSVFTQPLPHSGSPPPSCSWSPPLGLAVWQDHSNPNSSPTPL